MGDGCDTIGVELLPENEPLLDDSEVEYLRSLGVRIERNPVTGNDRTTSVIIESIKLHINKLLENSENLCYDPEEYKVNMGQGETVVNTNFFTPNSSENSWWIQTSVPGVKAQPWASSYRDGYCGIRVLD